MLKADADAKVPPQPGTLPAEPAGGSLLSLGPAAVQRLTGLELTKLVKTLMPNKKASVTLREAYRRVAEGFKLDPRIEEIPGGILLVIRSAWDELQEIADGIPAPGPKGPGKQQNTLKLTMAALSKQATTSLPINTVKRGLNTVIESGVLTRKPFKKGPWAPGVSKALVTLLLPPDANPILKDAWAQILVPGKLVSADKSSVKLTAVLAQNLKSRAAKLTSAKKAEKKISANYTKVNRAEIISKLNRLNVSTVKFDVSGSGVELADALKTFFENTGSAKPAGDLVRMKGGVNGETFVLTKALAALADAAKQASRRAQLTQQQKVNAIDGALRESSAEVHLRDVQAAFKETAASGKGGKDAALYRAVKMTGSLDKPTRAAYTAFARTATIGPAFQNVAASLKAQLGPVYKSKHGSELRNQMWGTFLEKAVTKKKGGDTIRMLPGLAAAVDAAAAFRKKRGAEKKDEDEDRKAQQALLAGVLAKSKTIVSVLDLQQALKRRKKGPIKLTGRANAATSAGLKDAYSGAIFGDVFINDITWAQYRAAVGINASEKGAKKGWSNANFISLPEPVADIVTKQAGAWVAQHGEVDTPGAIPSPKTGEVVRVALKGQKVLGKQAPPKAAPPVPTEINFDTPGSQAGGGQAAGGAGGQVATGPQTAGGAQVGPQTAGGAQVTGPSITGPSIQGPTINIQIPQQQQAAVPAAQAGMVPSAPKSNTGLLIGGTILALGVGYLALQGGSGAVTPDQPM
jgi:hypothetical protein